MKKEYLVIGSDNYWYASRLRSLEDAEAEAMNIAKHPGQYGRSEIPAKLYIFKAEIISEIRMDENPYHSLSSRGLG